MKKRIITRTVLLLSFVSLFTDMASEMLYPILPLFLQKIGFSIVLIGFLEGVAEVVAGLSKGYFGKLSDDFGKRLPFVQLGYFLSAISKPMMAIFAVPWWIFSARSIDRIGKGLRTAARDVMLSVECDVNNKGKVFGFHRSMDTVGAFIGPLLALLFLMHYPERYELLFLLAFIPGLASILLTFLIKEKTIPQNENKPNQKFDFNFISFLNYFRKGGKTYKQLVITLVVFAIVNSSDVFLLLILKQNGFSDLGIIKIYIFYNLIYALSAYPIGILGDRIGLKWIFIIGVMLFSVVYGSITFLNGTLQLYIIFVLYGLYAACTEGVSKAMISLVAPQHSLGTAIGTYEAFKSVAGLLSSSLMGILWYKYGATAAFLTSSFGAFFVIISIGLIPKLNQAN